MNQISADGTRAVARLVQTVQAAVARGVMIEAERAYVAALDIEPAHPEALAFVAGRALASGRAGDAVSLYERLVAARPGDVAAMTGLGQARLTSGQFAGASESLSAVLALAPDAFVARFHLAQALERSGDAHGALVQYFRAISEAQGNGRWLNDATTHPSLRAPLQRAMAFVDKGRLALYDQVLEPLRQRFGMSEMARIEQCLRICLHMQPPPYQDVCQRPTFLYFPGLPTTPYLPKTAMRWLDQLKPAPPSSVKRRCACWVSIADSSRFYVSTRPKRPGIT